jgi:diguanylate cyclase (GGDEF)-like protein
LFKSNKCKFYPQFLCLCKITTLALIYFITGKLSLLVSHENNIITIVYFIPEGFSLAAMLIYGRVIWGGVLIGQFLLALDMGVTPFPAICIAAINSAESIIGVLLFKHFGLNKSLKQLKDVAGLMLIISLVLQPISALFGNLVLVFSSVSDWQAYLKNVFSWWFGNTMGQVLFTPFLLLLYSNFKELKIKDIVIDILFFGLLSYLILIAFPIKSLAILMTITMPLIVFIALHKNIFLAYTATIVISITSLYAVYIESGAFIYSGSIDNLIDLNFFILTHIFLALIVGTLFNEKKESEEKLKLMAIYDYLTGLPNRNLLKERLHHVIAMAHRHNTMSAICFVDVDGFKAVNDIFGHNIGDSVLKIVAQRISRFIREEDSLIRLGGDEFLIILEGVGTNESVTLSLTRISSAINQAITVDGSTINVSLSIGVAICPNDGDTVVDLMSLSDGAMYIAKEKGKNCIVFHE